MYVNDVCDDIAISTLKSNYTSKPVCMRKKKSRPKGICDLVVYLRMTWQAYTLFH